ncbi:MAG TPA: VanZ family protein [Candidatus Caccenecus avistercoris]|nr:VanZ family protein [Candidatus Caccenecus avistercoris]
MVRSIMTILTESIDNMWPMLTIFLVVIAVVRVAAIKNHNEKLVFYKEFSNLLFIIYILLLYELLTRAELNTVRGYNLVPFSEMFRYEIGSTSFYLNVVGNIVIFIPFGYLISTYIKPKRILSILIVSVISSATVEFVQLCIGRSFDVDDIILNSLGAIIGFLIYIGLGAIKKHLPGIFKKDIIYNILCFIILIIMVLYLLSRMGVNII